MTQLPDFVKPINKPVYQYKFSVCTLVTRHEEYLEMLNSFLSAGFTEDVCEYLLIDNSCENVMDAYDGINSFLQIAKGEYLILCHQDIVLNNNNDFALLNQKIAEITELDANWALLGNAGASARLYDRLAINISYSDGFVDKKGKLPKQVASLDENFIVVKSSANLSVSHDIGGYHLYGLDLCFIAAALGYTAFVIEFMLTHKSRGNVDASFSETLKRVKRKYVQFLKGRYINTTIARFYLSGSKVKNALFHTRVFRRVLKTAEEIKSKFAN
jgi:hypothetical protein